MSLLLVLSHMDFKLDMEVRAATVIFSNHFELQSNKNFLFLYTELQFSGWELAPAGKSITVTLLLCYLSLDMI